MGIYQHPLGYLLGLEGLALLRGWAGDLDREVTTARLADVRRLVTDPRLRDHPGVEVERGSYRTGYRQWAASYDEPNGLFDIDQPFVSAVLDGLPAGTALDAACGTGRFADQLIARGHQVLGVDGSIEMLRAAQARVPRAHFGQGALDALPVRDGAIDLVVCALALSHLRSVGPAMAEFARVLRPGGHLVITDVHPELVFRGSVVPALGPHGEPGLVETHRHAVGDYLRAGLAAGLTVRACEELGAPETAPDSAPEREPQHQVDPGPETDRDAVLADWSQWPWSLLEIIGDAVPQAWNTPSVLGWHFQR